MSCQCLRANSIINCVETLEVGYVVQANADLYVYVKNITTGRISRYTSTSDGTGFFSISVGGFNDNHLYEITATASTTTNMEDTLLLTVDGTDTCCIRFTARSAYYAGDIDPWLTQTITAETCTTP